MQNKRVCVLSVIWHICCLVLNFLNYNIIFKEKTACIKPCSAAIRGCYFPRGQKISLIWSGQYHKRQWLAIRKVWHTRSGLLFDPGWDWVSDWHSVLDNSLIEYCFILKGEEDRRRDGKQHQRMDRNRIWKFPEGSRRQGKGLLQRHLWCPDDRQG